MMLTVMFSLCQQFRDFDVKDQNSIRWNLARPSDLSIAKLWRNDQFSPASDFHPGDPFSQSFNDPGKRDLRRRRSITTVLKFCAIHQSTSKMPLDCAVSRHDVPRPLGKIH